MKNMKIAVTADQPLEGIVKELERLGYRKSLYTGYKNGFICACSDGGIMDLKKEPYIDIYKTTTLEELKNMKCFEH